MKISNTLYAKMVRANKIADMHRLLVALLDEQLMDVGIDIEELRQNDAGGYVDMVDYGRGDVPKRDLELLFEKYRKGG